MGEGENTHQAASRSRLPDSATPTGERLSKGAVDGIQGHVVHGTGPQCVAVAPASVGHELRSLRHARPPVRADEDSPVRVVGWGGTDGRSHLVPARYALRMPCADSSGGIPDGGGVRYLAHPAGLLTYERPEP